MTRELINLSASELRAMAETYWDDARGLRVVRKELENRRAIPARDLSAKIDARLGELAKAAVQVPLRPAPAPSRRHLTMDALNQRIADHWHDPPRLEQLLLPLSDHPDQLLAEFMAAKVGARVQQLVLDKAPSTPERRAVPQPTPTPQATMTSRRKLDPESARMTAQGVAQLRSRLIDLTRRNKLIAFSHSGVAATQLRIVDERPDLLFEAIQKHGLGFEPLPGETATPADETTPTFRIAYERGRLTDTQFLQAVDGLGTGEDEAATWHEAETALRRRVRAQLGLPSLAMGKGVDIAAIARAHGFNPSFDLKWSDDEGIAPHHTDGRVRVLLMARELEKRLKGIWDRYRSHERETGLHTLYLALGFVEWFEDGATRPAYYAPLLLLPVELERRVVRSRYEYTMRTHDEGLQVNMALVEKARQHWQLEFPGLRENETPESYFVRVGEVLKRGERLSLRSCATLAVLPFPRMVLWKDLDPEEWADDAFASHRLLPGLLGTTSMPGDGVPAEPVDIDAPEWADRLPPLVRPADASQHAALIDTCAGHDLAIEGPPGTGKSETITNIIATALQQGKRVLFMAEKQAALRVVADRLRAAGLGPLLLELHGENAKRGEVYDSIRERLKVKPRHDRKHLEGERAVLASQRTILRRYLSLLDHKLGALERTAYQLVWRHLRLHAQLREATREAAVTLWKPVQPENIGRSHLADSRSALENFASALVAIETAYAETPRSDWLAAGHLPPFDQKPQRAAAAEAASAAVKMIVPTQALVQLGLVQDFGPNGPLEAAAAQFAVIEPFADVDDRTALAALRAPEAARALLRQQLRWRQLCARLVDDVRDAAGVEPEAVQALAHALADIDDDAGEVADVAAVGRSLATAEALQALATARWTEVEAFATLLPLDGDVPVEAAAKAVGIVAELCAQDGVVQSLFNRNLLDPAVGIALGEMRGQLAGFTAKRTELAQTVTDNGLDGDPAELERVADTLEGVGWLGRMFRSEVRAAIKRARYLLLADTPRDAVVPTLRRAARMRRQVLEFRESSPLRNVFPALLWKGVDSDWDSLAAAQDLLSAARRSLIEARLDHMLGAWLALDSDQRVRSGVLADRLTPLFAALTEHGFHDFDLASTQDAISSWREGWARLDAGLTFVGAVPSAPLVRDGQDLAARLGALRAASDEFERLRRIPELEPFDDISRSLDELSRAITQVDALAALEGPFDVAEYLRGDDAPVASLAVLAAGGRNWIDAFGHWRGAAEALAQASGITAARLPFERASSAAEQWAGLARRLIDMERDAQGIALAADLLKYRAALDEAGLAPLANSALHGTVGATELPDLYEYIVVGTLLMHYIGADGRELGRLGGLSLQSARETFVSTDKTLHSLEAAAILAQRLATSVPRGIGHGPRSTWTDSSLLDNELGLQRPRTPLRDVIHRAGEAMAALKPVWMMSPSSVAEYVRPGGLKFDLVVVDEASQMRPEYAVGAILRADQFVVVGDPNQLPPSSHFETNDKPVDDEADDIGVSADTESILDLANQRFRRKRRLKWHYRSQHESLIQFSNREFYQRDLVVFPSPMGQEDDLLGVRCTYVPAERPDTLYEASINQREAEAVIEEAFRLMRAYPERSLGICAMNAKQTELIQLEFDRLQLEQGDVRAFIESYAGTIDEFFIKSLENVQGDERDIILVSTVYGPGRDGVVKQNFGLMNREVGWRRLNVLVTRAKLSTRLFTSLRPNDVKVTPTSSRGIQAFSRYLAYAHGGALVGDASGGDADSDFETFVADALREAGYEVVHQVGVEGFRIDLGVKHSDCPVGFIAGIECDGAPFHSGLSVRDRDRIRQLQLEALGWKIYRIWSVDWFANPKRELDRLLEMLGQWRETAAAVFARRPTPAPSQAPIARETAADEAPGDTHVAPTLIAPSSGTVGRTDVARVEPTDAPRRILDEDIIWYEVVKASLYDIWINGHFAGEVEVLSRATQAPRLYGSQVVTAKSEYEGVVGETGERFRLHDIYATIREVARRAKKHIPVQEKDNQPQEPEDA